MIKSQILKMLKNLQSNKLIKRWQKPIQLKKMHCLKLQQWWQERRAEDEHAIAEAQSNGYEAGYQQGQCRS